MMTRANTRMKMKKITRTATKITKAEPEFRGFGGRTVRGRADSERLFIRQQHDEQIGEIWDLIPSVASQPQAQLKDLNKGIFSNYTNRTN